MLQHHEAKDIQQVFVQHKEYTEKLRTLLTPIMHIIAAKYKNRIDGNFHNIQYFTVQQDVLSIHVIDKLGNYFKVYNMPLNLLHRSNEILQYFYKEIENNKGV